MNHLTDTQIQSLIEEPKENVIYHDHILECSQCRQVYDSLREVHIRLSNMEYEKPSLRFAKNIYDIITRRQQLDQKEVKWVRTIQVSLLSSVFLGLILSFYYLFSRNWDLPLSDDSVGVYYKWSFTILLSIIMLWLLYGIDSWLAEKKRS